MRITPTDADSTPLVARGPVFNLPHHGGNSRQAGGDLGLSARASIGRYVQQRNCLPAPLRPASKTAHMCSSRPNYLWPNLTPTKRQGELGMTTTGDETSLQGVEPTKTSPQPLDTSSQISTPSGDIRNPKQASTLAPPAAPPPPPHPSHQVHLVHLVRSVHGGAFGSFKMRQFWSSSPCP